MSRRKGPPRHDSVEADVKRDLSRLARVLHITREFVVRCLEALTVEFCILCILRFSWLAGAAGVAAILTR